MQYVWSFFFYSNWCFFNRYFTLSGQFQQTRNFAIFREEISVKNQKIYDSTKGLLLLNLSNRTNFAEKLLTTVTAATKPQNSFQEIGTLGYLKK